jgi:hypothetical protein
MGIKRISAVFAMLTALCGCATGAPRGYVDVSAVTANYTDKYIDYSFTDANGKPLGLGGGAKPFVQGGTGGTECCAFLPGVGQTLRVTWREGGHDDGYDQMESYSRDVTVIGSPPVKENAYNYLIVRFFSGHQVEIEFVSEDTGLASRSSRLDKLFYGERTMRHIGE